MNVQNKKITVLGLGKSGYESAFFLKKYGAHVFVTESGSDESLKKRAEELKSFGILVEIGKHTKDQILGSEFVVMSPGIPPTSDIYRWLTNSGIPIWSEIELAFRFCKNPIVAVTGTNGKTTVTTLIAKLLNEQGRSAVTCGNIGNPFISEIQNLHEKSIVVLEVSSFQLQNIHQFKPYIAVLLNLTDNHFDWHGNFESYAEAKWRIFENQNAHDFALINTEDFESMKRSSSIRARKIYFDSGEFQNPNFSACYQVLSLFGLDKLKTLEILKNFKGIEHRMEEVASHDGIRYINDSKSTTIASLQWALGRVKQNAVLIMGGKHKGGDFSVLETSIRQKVKSLILIGEATPLIERAFSKTVSITKAPSLQDAVKQARQAAGPGGTVLFSPACASFDMFQNYQDRGQKYKEIIAQFQMSEQCH